MGHFVVAVTRTCGSGGTTVGKMLCDAYGIPLYDKNLLRLASEDSGISEDLFRQADETMKRSLLYKVSRRIYHGELIPPESSDYASNDNLFNFQAKVLKELAARESYVCIGRAADFVLKENPNVVRVFLHASHDRCVTHEMERSGLTRKEAEEHIERMDRYRSEYYTYHTGRRWLDVRNYDLSINTNAEHFEHAVRLIRDFIGAKQMDS
jgi:cytidylate kinase